MSASLRLAPVATLIAGAFAMSAAAAASGPGRALGGVVSGADGKPYAHARVCIDRNRNARCDRGEAAAWSTADGHFMLRGSGMLLAEVGTDARSRDPATHEETPVRRPFVLRAPARPGDGPRHVDPLSTELQAMVDGGASLAEAERSLLARLGLPSSVALGDPAAEPDAAVRDALLAEQARLAGRLESAVAAAGAHGDRVAALRNRLDLDEIRNVVVIYAENRSFDNLFAGFPGARATQGGHFAAQKDRDGTPLAKLPPVWKGLTDTGEKVVVDEARTTNVLPNAPFQIDAAKPVWGEPALTDATVTRDLYHRFYENQMQIAGGANDQFVAWADSGGLPMGYFDGSRMALWKLARQYTLADAFFQGAFGGSFLNHQYLICACAPEYPNADTSPAKPSIAALQLDDQGRATPRLALAPNSPKSALQGPPVFVRSGNITPKDYLGDGSFHAVNTMQPAYQPSYVAPAAEDAGGKYANPLAPTTLPVQTRTNIGDLLTLREVSWAWYSGGWNVANADRTAVYDDKRGSFQSHHQPFNYYASFDPATAGPARAAHLKDEADLVADAVAGKLPAVTFYKPIGTYNEHPSTTSLALGDAHLAELVGKLRQSPQWKHMLLVITYDEFGGQWDEAAPPKGDLVGPGTRIPAIIVSPYARRGFVDHTQYDTGSILRFVTHRFALPELQGLRVRDEALVANGGQAMGDLTDALDFPRARSSK